MDINELREVSAFIGGQINLVQGPGGNTSIKTENRLYVKASGTRLDEALERDIFAEIDLVTGENYTPHLRPSIEIGLHRALPFRAVIHVHSVGSLAWGLRLRSELEDTKLESLGILCAPYLRPGDEITRYLQNSKASLYQGILLQNHGFITWGEDCRLALSNLIALESNLVSLAKKSIKSTTSVHSFKNLPKGIKLTPDHAVFSGDSQEDSVEKCIVEALDSALNLIPIDSKITSINNEEADALRNWEAEKYRKGIN